MGVESSGSSAVSRVGHLPGLLGGCECLQVRVFGRGLKGWMFSSAVSGFGGISFGSGDWLFSGWVGSSW